MHRRWQTFSSFSKQSSAIRWLKAIPTIDSKAGRDPNWRRRRYRSRAAAGRALFPAQRLGGVRPRRTLPCRCRAAVAGGDPPGHFSAPAPGRAGCQVIVAAKSRLRVVRWPESRDPSAVSRVETCHRIVEGGADEDTFNPKNAQSRRVEIESPGGSAPHWVELFSDVRRFHPDAFCSHNRRRCSPG